MKSSSTQGAWSGAMPALMSFFIPGVGQLVMGLWIRGAAWFAGWVALLVLGAGHLLPGLLLMAASGVDALMVARLRRNSPPTPTS